MSTTIWIIIGIVIFIVLISAALSIASFSSERFSQEYEKLSNIPIIEGFSILDFIHMLNHNFFNDSIQIRQVEKDTENFYSPRAKVVALSKRTLSSNSLASFAIVAHEMGHALQDKEGRKLKILNALRRLGYFVGFLFLPLILAGVVLLFVSEELFSLGLVLLAVAGGILLFAILIKAITISIEKDASEKGIEFLKEMMSDEEVSACKKLLNTARLTYWGDLFRLLLSWTMLTKKTAMFR